VATNPLVSPHVSLDDNDNNDYSFLTAGDCACDHAVTTTNATL
jgi:hypothetical protein